MNIELMTQFYQRLRDDESKQIYELKLQMNLKRDYVDFINGIIDLQKEWEISEYDDCIQSCKGKEIIIFGAGIDGKMTWYLLRQRGVQINYFCDNDREKWGKNYCGVPVISAEQLKTNHRDGYVILASIKYAPLFYSDLIGAYFPRKNIWYPRNGSLYATNGKQYFDCPEMVCEDGEIFIDCGCFDGETDKQFIAWCGGKYKRIIAFEPDAGNYKIAKRNCADIDNFEIYQAATGKTVGQSYFDMHASSGSRLNKSGESVVQTESIDHVLQGQKATFIKMDIEGAELDSLLGAETTIKKYKPKLAISIYHKEEDIFAIPNFIMSCRDDYRFYIRHYTSCTFETILYAL